MATGDAAANAGLAVFSATQDHGQGYDNDNVRGDELADHMVNGTHPWSKIVGKPSRYPAADDSVGTAQIKDKAVTGAKIADQTITSVKIASGGVGSSEIRDAAVGTSEIADGAVTSDKVAFGLDGAKILNGSVGTAELASDAVTGAKIASNSISQHHLTNGTVGWAELTSSVESAINNSAADKVTSNAYGRSVSGGGYYSMWMDSGLRIGRNVSSIRYKEDVAPHEVDPASVLALQPVTYRRKNDPSREYEYGLIAEEVLAAGVPELVVYYDGKVDGVRYDLVAVTLLSVVKDHEARMAEQADRITALEAAVAALTPTETTGEGA